MRATSDADADADPTSDDSKPPHKPRLHSRRVVPTTSPSLTEKPLPNGDLYIGDFQSRAPHGHGKYLWADGCMYEGSWRRGKAAGKGKFSWPSGATYEGSFRAGRMDGHGTFTAANGDTYSGSWVGDRKQGVGCKSYCNGDYYEGTWRRNLQDGSGRYRWGNGNQYVGEWRNGVISGRGVLIWANGNRYDGHWENGVPKGSGVFTWPDGSCYVGNWSKDQLQLNGTFYPASSGNSAVNRLPEELPLSRFSGEEASPSPAATEKHFPRICIWDSDGEAGDITCDIVDTLEIYRDSSMEQGGEMRRKGAGTGTGPCCFNAQQGKRPGQTIFKGHKNYDLMLNLQLGISYSVGKLGSKQLRELVDKDFDGNQKFWTRFPPEGSKGSKVTPSHQSYDFRWKDYCPMVFSHLRELFEVDPAEYMVAICGNDALRELSSPGKSGSLFYMTQDDRFMIKTVKKSEVKVLIRMLPSYYKHVSLYKNSLVTKFFGVHCVKPIGGQKIRFIVMGNLFCSEYRIHKRFDLKGSSHGRTTDKAGADIDETTTLKDLDLNFLFRLQKSWFDQLIEQIGRDCEFLEGVGIMDYSLLVGVHFRDDIFAAKTGSSQSNSSNSGCKTDIFQVEADFSDFSTSNSGCQDMDQIMDGRKPLIRLGANMPARVMHVSPKTFLSGETSEVILYFGIIDILQDYDISKKLEHAYKSLQVDPTSISAVDPKLYSRRFRDFIRRVFVEDD